MGRHRRCGPDAQPVVVSDNREGRPRGAHRRPRERHAGLLGASAALTVGAVAVGASLLPGVAERLARDDSSDLRALEPDTPPYELLRPSGLTGPDHETTPTGGSDRQERDRETPRPTDDEEEDGTDRPTEDDTASPSPTDRASSSPTAEESTPAPSPTPTPEQTTRSPEPEPEPSSPPTTTAPDPTSAPEVAAAEQVITLVNEERARAGCAPLVRDDGLTRLAQAHSRDMAERGYFSHDDPEGRTPWDRAAAAGVDNLGGENIAKGQTDAQTVMASWMASDGHRANILNCDFRTIGVGVHFADGGPWWTQEFGY